MENGFNEYAKVLYVLHNRLQWFHIILIKVKSYFLSHLPHITVLRLMIVTEQNDKQWIAVQRSKKFFIAKDIDFIF